jgi:UDP-3-O-[3-hydroxymyristoyl] glucosamine N-acyltransferase
MEERAPVTITVEQIACLVQGKVRGDAQQVVEAARSFGEAGAGDVTFLESVRNLRLLGDCKAGVVVIPPAVAEKLAEVEHPFVTIEVADPLTAFIRVVQHLQGEPEADPALIDEMARIHPTARLGDGCTVMAFAVLGAGTRLGDRCCIHPNVVVGRDCVLGDDVVLHPGVVLYDRTVIGSRSVLHASAVVGADGFGYRFQGGRQVKVPQLGNVEIGEDVEVGAGTTIDRGTFQATRIGDGTKIDNLVMIAHNVKVGRHNLIVGQAAIAGSSTTGDYVVLAGQVGVGDHVTIGDRVIVGARSAVPGDIAAGQRVLGIPARPEREGKRILLSIPRLPDLLRDVRQIKEKLGLLGTGDDLVEPKEAA